MHKVTPTLCMPVIFHDFLLSAVIFQQYLFQNILLGTTSVSNSTSLDPDQAIHSVGPDLGSNYL